MTWGRTTHTGVATLRLPISYSSYFVPMASINNWTANDSYSVCTTMVNKSEIRVDHWYGKGTSLGYPCSWLTLGY